MEEDPKPPKVDDPEVVWMKCRAKAECPGNYAKVVFRRKMPIEQGGGTAIRYKCMLCKGAWHIKL